MGFAHGTNFIILVGHKQYEKIPSQVFLISKFEGLMFEFEPLTKSHMLIGKKNSLKTTSTLAPLAPFIMFTPTWVKAW
jgi:hypothetical protein